MPKVLIAGGGSGGHVTPAIAVAESLTDLGADILIAHSGRTIDRVLDRKSTRLNSSHVVISYAVFCLKKKKNKKYRT